MKAPLNMERVSSLNRAELDAACIADGHVVPPGATHLYRDPAGKVVSAISLFTPVCMFWADSQKLKAADSLPHLKRCRKIAVQMNPHFLLACSPESPYRPHLEKHFGFKLLGGVEVFEPLPDFEPLPA